MAVVFGGRPMIRRDIRPYAHPPAAGTMAPAGTAGMILQRLGAAVEHPVHAGGPVDRIGGFRDTYSGPRSGGTGLAHAILVGQAKTRPVNAANRSSKGGLFALLAASAQRAMEQKAQMSGQYHSAAQGRMRALQQLSANLHA